MTKHGYEIGAKGRVPAALLEEIGAEAPVIVPTQTVLTTGLIDQDGLHQLIRRIADLGLEVWDVREVTVCSRRTAPIDAASAS